MFPLSCLAIPYPAIDPIALSIGPVTIYWYGLMYVVGILSCWKIAGSLLAMYDNQGFSQKQFDDSVVFLIMGLLIGGRLGHVLFYDPQMIVRDPLEIFKTWNGGMSFHGGIIGVMVCTFYFSWRHKISFLRLLDIYTCVLPLGIFFGRIGNFINGELFGRVADVPWAMIFPHGGPYPRHPSQLYEAVFEGIYLFAIMLYCWTRTDLPKKPGKIAGIFGIGYSFARIFCEFFREPDAYVMGDLTIGQLLTLPLLGIGWFLVRRPLLEKHQSNQND